MTDVDHALRRRLARLEEAVPVRPWERPAARRHGRRRVRPRTIALLAAALLIVSASAVTAQRVLYPTTPEPELEAALERIWGGQRCVSAPEARAAIQDELDRLRYDDWTIEDEPFLGQATCVAAGVISELREVRLWPGISVSIERTQEAIIDGMLDTCMGRAEAIQYVTSMLTTAGSDPFVVKADPWGPQGGPLDRIEEYQAHVAAGCFVYVGMPTRDAQGRAEHWLWGPWP
jgi:DNA-binding IclR family transcriptional regulator